MTETALFEVGAQRCLYVHPDNIKSVRKLFGARTAVIARPDQFLAESPHMQLIVETDRGVHTRLFITEHKGIRFVVVYGRFGRIRTTAADIDYELTQSALNFIGIDIIIGMFVTGSVKKSDLAGAILLPHDFIGLGGYNSTLHREAGFRNVDSFIPFCSEARKVLTNSAAISFPEIKRSGVYACFHGYPRIETAAELAHYEHMGCDAVGQTLDPEATLAREAGCHYAPIAATIDDAILRNRFLANDKSARKEIEEHTRQGRRKMFELFLAALPDLNALQPSSCNCSYQKEVSGRRSSLFYYRPSIHIHDKEEDAQ